MRAPATSANLGPGFDCLGLALDLWNEVQGRLAPRTSLRTHEGPAAPSRTENLVLRAACRAFEYAGQSAPHWQLTCTNRIPMGRGLGSSAAAISCGLLLANCYLPEPLPLAILLELAATIEGHPDNVTPCLLGGVRAALLGEDGRVVQAEIRPPVALVAAVFVPEAVVPTELARAALPATVPFRDAVFNVAHACLLVAALGSGTSELLREATRDRLHQPYRENLFPAGAPLQRAALEAGALGAFTSGAGPAVLALCTSASTAERVAQAMLQQARSSQVAGDARAYPVSTTGAHIVGRD